MSTRSSSRRSRGRPPKTPLSKSTDRTNLLRKPKAYQNRDSNLNSSNTPSPVSHLNKRGGGARSRGGRASAIRGRHFLEKFSSSQLNQNAADDDDISSLPDFEDRISDVTDLENEDGGASDASFGDVDLDDRIDSGDDNESLSTVSSSISRKRLLLKRPRTPDFIEDEEEIPTLELPASATDLLLPAEHVLQAMGIYEVIRHFKAILRLSPFTFEDFCACLLSEEQNNLLAEIHITLLKSLFREEEASNCTFGPQDLKDSINVSLFFLDSMTWPEIVRMYLDSEKHPEYRVPLSILECPDYPYVPYEDKLKVLQTLTDLFLAVTKVREEIINEGNILYDDHCRSCHKLGDLLCCETCSAVYHLACVEPPMQEVPVDDWLCSVCRIHKIKGVSDCVTEAEKSGLLCRHDPIGYDRNTRKYWFLCRRIVVEGEKETKYYSTKYQLEELLDCLESDWEADLISFIKEMKEDIVKQMATTEAMTNGVKGSRKSMLDVENADLVKIQAERALIKAQKEEERRAKEEEEKRKKEEEDTRKREEEEKRKKDEEEKKRIEEEEKKKIEEEAKKRDNEERKRQREARARKRREDGEDYEDYEEEDDEELTDYDGSNEIDEHTNDQDKDQMDQVDSVKPYDVDDAKTEEEMEVEMTETVETDSQVTSKVEETTEVMKELTNCNTTTTEVVQTTMVTTTVTTVKSTTTTSSQASDSKEDEPPAKIARLDETTGSISTLSTEGLTDDKSKEDKAAEENKITLSTKSVLAEAIKASSDGKPKVINLQTLLPAARASLLNMVGKNGDDAKNDPNTKTVLLVNREGGKVTLQVQRQPLNKTEGSGENSITQTSSSTTLDAMSSSKSHTTRSKTGSLTPKVYTDAVTITTTTSRVSGNSQEEVLVMTKDGEISRVNKGHSTRTSVSTSLATQSVFFKLGVEGAFKKFDNQFVTNTLALNKHQHNEDRDKKRHLSHKFSLTQTCEFKWSGNVVGNRMSTLATLRMTISALEGLIQAPFLHSLWPNHRQNWQKAVQMCQSPRDFALALTILEACIKPCVFIHVWHEGLGHLRLNRITIADREEWKKKEKEQKKPEDVTSGPLVWIKYTLGLKHQVWKQKGEEYRVTSGKGWQWISATRNAKKVSQDSVGLRLSAQRLKNRKLKAAKLNTCDIQGVDGEKPVVENEIKTEEKVVSNDPSTEKVEETKMAVQSEKKDIVTDKVETKMDVDCEKKESTADKKEMENNIDAIKIDSTTPAEDQKNEKDDDSEQKDTTEQVEETKKSIENEKKDSTSDGEVLKTNTDSNGNAPIMMMDVDDVGVEECTVEAEDNTPKEEVKIENIDEDSNGSPTEEASSSPAVEVKDEIDADIEEKENKSKSSSKSATLIPKVCLTDVFSKKDQQRQSSASEFMNFMKSKYVENKDTVLALDLLKKHPPKVADVDVINVSDAIQKQVLYSKVTKPYSKLDGLLDRRIKQDEFERKQRMSIETQIALKTKLNQAIEEAKKEKEENKNSSPKPESKTVTNDKCEKKEKLLYSCYSLACRTNDNGFYSKCYSPACRSNNKQKSMKNSDSDMSLNKEGLNSNSMSAFSSMDSSKEGSRDDSRASTGTDSACENGDTDFSDLESKLTRLAEEKTLTKTKLIDFDAEEDEEVDIEGDIKDGSPLKLTSNHKASIDKTKLSSGPSKFSLSSKDTPKNASVSDIVKNLVIKTMAEKAASGKGPALSAAALAHSVEELQAKLPPRRTTRNKFKLAKYTRFNAKKPKRDGKLPMCHKFETTSKKRSILILEKNELRKIARQGAKRESVMFNYNCKMNNVCWPYPCPRPNFKTSWRYRTMTLQSLSAAALQLRILWGCIRWDDMLSRPPAGGTNTVSTETEITTTELLKRREVGVDGLRSEFLVRKIVVPLGVPHKPKENYTPQRSGLRQRKIAEANRQLEPSVTEVWVPETVLDLWEIKQFGEKLEKQRVALQNQEKEKEKAASMAAAAEKAATQTTVNSQQSAQQIKAQMEQQLKQQRLALNQKRMAEGQGIRISSGTTVSMNGSPTITTTNPNGSVSGTTIIINNNAQGKPGTTFKTLTVPSTGSLLSSNIIKTMQPKTIIANSNSLLGSQLRPGIRVQLPGSAIKVGQQTVTLAPKPGMPGTQLTTRLISPAMSGTRLVTPGNTQVQAKTIQIKPPAGGQPVQNLHFIQTPSGQLQVRGLQPGQIIQRMADGKLQIITLNSQASSVTPTNTVTSQVNSLSTLNSPRPPPRQVTVVSTPSAAPQMVGNRLVIPTQLNMTGGAATQSLRVAGATGAQPPKQIIINRPGGPQVISAQSLASVLGSQASQLLPPASSPAASAPLTIISAPNMASVVAKPTTTLVNPSGSSVLLSSLGSVASPGLISTLRPTPTTLTQATASTSLLAPQPVSGITGTSLLQRTSAQSLLSGGSINISAGPKVLSPAAGQQIITGPGAPQQILRLGSQVITAPSGQPKVITAEQLRGLTQSPIQLKPAMGLGSPIKSILPPGSTLLPSVGGMRTLGAATSLPLISGLKTLAPSMSFASLSPQPGQDSAMKQILVTSGAPQGASLLAAPQTSEGGPLGSPTAGTSPSAGAAGKYAITPQVVEQVVRQALLQNQTPEIQQKLLAMQKQIQSQSGDAPSPPPTMFNLPSVSATKRTVLTSTLAAPRTPRMDAVPLGAEGARSAKLKSMTPEQRDDQSRVSVCGQVMKYILDRIEREEKQEQRKKKQQESAEEKQKRMVVVNQQKALYRHKETLKKEIHRKRSIMEKNLQQDIYNEMAERLKVPKTSVSSSKSPPAAAAHLPSLMPTQPKVAKMKLVTAEAPKVAPVTMESKAANRKRKQKMITSHASSGVRGLNPMRPMNVREKLYCVCKQPYDETKFYIGCDLCSNWFHGACVGIMETEANYIDSYVCEECRKQQENTSEELYCLCRTPYDEAQFYIGCDRCQDWFHGRCVGISKAEADNLDNYVCPKCDKEEKTDPIVQKPLTPPEYQHLTRLLKDLQVHKMSWPFLNPVDPREVPDYYNIVSEPMDLTIVEAKLNAKAYNKLNDFLKDVTKIFDNCRLYNPVDTAYFQCAEVVETFFAQRVKALRSANKL